VCLQRFELFLFEKKSNPLYPFEGPNKFLAHLLRYFNFCNLHIIDTCLFFYFSTYKFDIKFKIYAMVEDMICYNNDLGFFSLLLFLQFCISNINLALDTPNYEIIIKNSNIFFLSYYDVLCQAIKIELRTQLLHGE